MTIRYEINPPKVSDPSSRIDLLDERIEQISKFCDGIHVTDSVLGIERISPLIIVPFPIMLITDDVLVWFFILLLLLENIVLVFIHAKL